jgi:hypothetical protein
MNWLFVPPSEKSGDPRFKLDTHFISEHCTNFEIRALERQCEQFVLRYAPKCKGLDVKDTVQIKQWCKLWKSDIMVAEISFDVSGRVCRVGVVVTDIDNETQKFISFNHKGFWGIQRIVSERKIRKCISTEDFMYIRQWKHGFMKDGMLNTRAVCNMDNDGFTEIVGPV